MSFPQGIAFRQTAGFVTDGANDYGETAISTNNYPTTSTQGNNVGYESGVTGSTRNRNAGNDPRIAGCHFASAIATYRIDLPATGNYKARIAMGDAASYGQAAKCEIFDTTTSLGVLSSTATTAAQRFRDATDTQYTNVTWPGSNSLSGSLTFASTICRFKFSDGSNLTAWAYVYVEAAGGAVALTGVEGTGSVGSVAASVSIALTGNAATGSVGSLTPSTGVVIALTGNEGTGSVGSLAPSVSIALSGNAVTGSVGDLTPVSGVIVALTGNSATGSVGSLAPSISIALTGNQAIGSVGSMSVLGADATVTPGQSFFELAEQSRRWREDDEPEAQPPEVIEAVKQDYERKSAVLVTILDDLQAESNNIRERIAVLEKRKTEKAERELTERKQLLVMAEVKRAIVLEEMEVMDVAYVAAAVLTLQ